MNLGELFVQIGAIGNSKEVKAFGEAVKKAGQAIDNYDKKLKKSQNSSNNLKGSIKGIIGVIVGIAGAVAGAYYALDKLTDSLAKNNLQWLNLTRQSDIALSTFQKWGTIGKIVGVDNAAQQLENLNQKIFNLRLTGEGAKGFQMAGIMPTNAEDVLEQLRGRIAGMSNTSATYLLQQMGLDPKMITLLRMGREEWEQYLEVQNRYTLNKDQREEIDRLNRQLEVARIKMQYLKDKAILAIMPAFTKFAKAIARVTELLVKFLEKSWRILGILTLWGLKFQKVRDFLSVINTSMKSIIVKIPIFGRLFANLGKIFSKVLFPLTALYLLLDDLAVFFEGGDSLIGRVLDWGKEKGGEIADGLKKIFGGDILGGVGDILNTILDTLNDILDFLKDVLENILNALTFGLYGKFRDSDIGNFLTMPGTNLLNDFTNSITPTVKPSFPYPTPSGNTYNNTNNPQITVYTSADTIKDIYQPVYLRSQSFFGGT